VFPSSSSRRQLAAAVLLAAVLSTSLPATSQAAPASFDALVEQGLVAYRARDYRQAVEKFLQANALQPDANLLFNLARCYEAMGDTRAAMEKYRLFLASPEADPAGRARAEDRLRVLRRRPARAPDDADSLTSGSASGETPRTGRHTLAVFGAVTGAAGVAAGALAYALGARDHQQVTGVPEYRSPGAVHPLTEVQAQRLAEAGRRKKTAGAVMAGAGGAVLAASLAAILFSRSGGENGSVAMGLTAEQKGGALLLSGRF
jgi:tetratricopeptide (TPR) repeat protein